MDFKIASTMNKVRITSRQAVNLNVNPNRANFAPQTGKTVKVQVAKAKSGLRKVFTQKPDEFVQKMTQEIEITSKKVKKSSKQKNVKKQIKQPVQVQTKNIIEDETQEISYPLMSKEEEQKWIDFALRNHNNLWDYKIPGEHYKSEIQINNLEQISRAKIAEDGYAKATEPKTKAYFDSIEADEQYKEKLFWKEIAVKWNKAKIVDINNKLRYIFKD